MYCLASNDALFHHQLLLLRIQTFIRPVVTVLLWRLTYPDLSFDPVLQCLLVVDFNLLATLEQFLEFRRECAFNGLHDTSLWLVRVETLGFLMLEGHPSETGLEFFH